MSDERPSGRPPWSGDAGARRLFGQVRDACAEAEDLPARLEAGLRAALGLLAVEPELAYRLTVDPCLGGDDAALDARRDWLERFAGLLAGAAAEDPRVTQESFFVASFLIGGVRFEIGRRVLAGEAADLLRLLPGILEVLLAYYFEPGEPQRLARAALGGPD
jgi:hypothetical protein